MALMLVVMIEVAAQQQPPAEPGQGGDLIAPEPREQQDGHRQQCKPEQLLDHVHPGARLGQQLAARGTEQQQRQPHAERQGIESRTAEPEIAALGHVDEGAGERGRGAGRADQAGDHPHDADSEHGAALLAVGEA